MRYCANMADPLSLLRQFNVNKKDITEKNAQIIFDEYSWPKTVKTNYLVWGSGKDGTPREYYTLQCLLFLLKNVHLSHPVYVRQAAAENIPVVRRPDRKDILAYLNGETATSANIDRSAPMEIPTQVKRTAEDPQTDAVKKPRLEETQMQRAKEQFSARLDAPKEAPVVTEQIRSLSEAMSVEKIAAIKAKRLAKKRATIKGDDDLGLPDIQGILEYDVDVTRDILSRERQWRTRATVLQSTGKNFAKSIFPILQSIKVREEGGTKQPPPEPAQAPRATPVRAAPQPAVYNRYDQERFRGKEETEGFKIDTMGTYHGMNLKSVTEGTQPKRPVAPAPAPAPVPAAPSSTAAAPTPRPVPKRGERLFVWIRRVTSDRRRHSRRQSENGGARLWNGQPLARAPCLSLEVHETSKRSRVWEARAGGGTTEAPSSVVTHWAFLTTRACALRAVKAFHLKWDEITLDSNVAKWAVHVIQLSKQKRHLDRANLLNFWEVLDRSGAT
ncbi:unnamed protein product, partial [Ixodes persulcatus]